MIASLRGRVVALTPSTAVLEVGGVGMQVQCSPGTLAELRLGAEATLATSLVVREDSLTLFGFADDDERAVFELLQTASGVGPRLAQAMLAVHPPDQLRQAVAAEDLASLTLVPGIGRKGAQRIMLELKDRLGSPLRAVAGGAPRDRGGGAAVAAGWREQVHGGLVGLGWPPREADSAVDAVAELADEQSGTGAPDIAVLLRAALRTLSRA
ncbi:MAG: Holliday junction branch migration protein RuvA [Nocardioidaceae bacterium]|nr:Holliday junction branch migration protein RuvA [Nocardioidaceae bacterium]